jgi:hypothetical protein
MMVDWTRNLSRHFADEGGSSFMGCSSTIQEREHKRQHSR